MDIPPTPSPYQQQEGLSYVPRRPPGEGLRTVRAMIVGIVIMWVVLVGAWALRYGLAQQRFTQSVARIDEARQHLAALPDVSTIFSEVNTVVEPAVVKLDVRRLAARPGPMGGPIPEANSGSGVIMEVDDRQSIGYVMTNNHVVVNANRIDVTLSDGRNVRGRVIGTDTESDLAVVAINAPNLIAAEWGDSDLLRKGEWVLAFGSPYNFVGSMTAGIVSALNRTQNDGIMTPLGPDAYQDFIQVDAAINPGNSGGPLVNLRGQIVGINTAIFSRTGDFTGIGFAIPSNQARRVFEDIRQDGRFIRGWLGVSVLPVQSIARHVRELGYDQRTGVLVTQVYRDTPAAEAGLQRNDIIISVDDVPIRDSQTLRNRTAFADLDQPVELEIFRDGETMRVPARIGPMPDDTMLLNLRPPFNPETLGLTLTRSRMGPLQVERIIPGTPAAQAGLRPGDYILEIEGQPVASIEQAVQMLEQLDPAYGIELLVVRGRQTYRLMLRED